MLLHHTRTSADEAGQGLAEYALILSLVAIVVVAALASLGTTLHNQYCFISYRLWPSADLSSACSVPLVMPQLIEQRPGYINLEANVYDPDGDPDDPYAAISKVEFYIDDTEGSPVQTELQYRYCLGGNQNGNPCKKYSIGGLSEGEHSVIVLAYDGDGNVGRASYAFTR